MEGFFIFVPMYVLYISLLLLYLGIGQLYNLEAIDKAMTQWVYLNTINILSFLTFIFKKPKKSFLKYLQSVEFILLGLFLVFLSISILYAENKTESLLKLSRWLTILVTTYSLVLIIDRLKPSLKLISALVTISLIADIYFSLDAYFQFIKYSPYRFEFANYLKGVTGNKNITSASFIIRLPFIFYLVYTFKSNALKSIFAIISATVVYLIFLLSARATFISLVLIFLLGLIFELIKKNKSKINSILFSLIFIIPFVLSLVTVQSNSTAFITNRITTINTNDESTSQRLRFYNHAIKSIANKPFTGVGLGNWKLKSIEYDKGNINSYIIPYHVHNDFLEIAAESGLFALLSYILLLFVAAKKFFLKAVFEIKNHEKYFGLIVLMSGTGFVIDSLLNFPHARPIVMIMFSLILALSISNKKTIHEK